MWGTGHQHQPKVRVLDVSGAEKIGTGQRTSKGVVRNYHIVEPACQHGLRDFAAVTARDIEARIYKELGQELSQHRFVLDEEDT